MKFRISITARAKRAIDEYIFIRAIRVIRG